MYLNEIDFPNKIIDAIKNDSLVVFAGAGASVGKPTSLPDFQNLTKQIAEDTGKELKKNDSCEVFLGSLKADGIPVNQQAADILSRNCLEHNKLHEAIIDLFTSIDKIKIVTTNYDQMFEQVVNSRNEKVTVYNVPALPLGNDVEGIIHIHGNVNNPKYMVLTDEDFGRAYLTDGYASKFLVQLFASYTVLFVGYSYNDTIMRYLTRAISKDTTNKKYILTDSKKANWAALGIEPIFYKYRSHAIMREGLVKLGSVSKKGLVEWNIQFSDIKDMPPKDLTIDTEIDYCLENNDRSKILANVVHEKEWMDYLDKKEVFAECFSDNKELSPKGKIWADWLCNNFVGKDDKSLLYLIYKHKNVLNSDFAEYLVRKLINNPDMDINSFMEYLLVLDKRIFIGWQISQLIKTLISKQHIHSAFILFKKLFDCKMQLEQKNLLQSDSVGCKHIFIGDYYDINTTWKMLREKAIDEFPYEIMLFVIEKITELHYKYEMAGLASKDEDPFELAMLEIEAKELHYKENPLQIMSQMLLDASYSLQHQNKELLKTTLLQGIYSESMLLKKITLKAIREISVFSPSEKLNIIIENNLIDSSFCKQQVFLLTSGFFADLSTQNKNRLINAIKSLKKEDASRTNLYEIYNWYIWLQKTDPNNEKVNNRIEQLQAKYNFMPRKHPELIMWTGPARWADDQSPLPEEEMIQLPVSEVINMLQTYNPDVFLEGPSRRGLLETFSSTLAKKKDWSDTIIRSLINEKINKEDIWQYVFYGIQKAEYKLDNVWSLFMFIIHNIDTVGYIYGAAECLWKILQRENIKSIFLNCEQDFFDAAEILWNSRKQEKKAFPKTIDATLNTTIGCILFSWIYMVSFIDERTIPKKYKIYFEEALKLESWEKNVSVCILAGHFNFFCYRDIEWSKKVLIPFFTCKSQALYTDAWTGIAYFSGRFNSDTADIIAPICYNAISNIRWLENDTKRFFIELLLTLMIHIVEKPTLKYIPEFYKNASKKDRKQFIQVIENRLMDMDKEHKFTWWNAWLKRFLENRKSNKPCILEDEENEAILDLLTVLPEVFDEAVDIICKGKMPENIDDIFWSELNDMHIAANYSHSMAKFLIKALNSISSLYLGKEDIREIVGELNNLEPRENKSLKEALLKWSID